MKKPIMNPSEVNRLAKKWREGTLGTEERLRFEQWYRSFDDSILEIDSDEGESAMRSRIYNQLVAAGSIPASARRQRLRFWPSAAAVALLLAVFGGYWNYQNAFTNLPWVAHKVISASEDVRQEILPDGSIVWLRPGSTLTFNTRFSNRDVTLKGEALFEVAKNPDKPFRVQAGSHLATVLGTSFNIRQSDDDHEMEVIVLTGKVAVSKQRVEGRRAKPAVSENVEEFVLTPNVRLKAREDQTDYIVALDTVDNQLKNDYIEGTTYDMWFEGTPFEEVADRMASKFNVEIEADNRYHGCRISANLSAQPLEYTAELVAAAMGATVEFRKGKIILKGGGCP